MNTLNTVTRINITVPQNLLRELEKEVPERGKSSFITAAIEEKLRRIKREEALKKLANLPPAFPTIKDGATYISNLRKTEQNARDLKLQK